MFRLAFNCSIIAGETVLHISAKFGHDKLTLFFLDKGADFNIKDNKGNIFYTN